MKRLLLLILLVYALSTLQNSLYAQGELWGVTGGGTYGMGELFKMNGDGSSFSIKHSFYTPYPGGPRVGEDVPVLAPNGKFYGTTNVGGIYNNGALYEYDFLTDTYSLKYNFQPSTGVSPMGGLLAANNGKLYGTTVGGGTYSYGGLFEYDPINNVYAKKVDFSYYTTGIGSSSLIQASDGKIYGTMQTSSTSQGNLFQFDLNTGVYTNIISFPPSLGLTNLIQASNGKLYGITSTGGVNNLGAIVEFDLVSLSFSLKFDFNTIDGAKPFGISMIQAANGKLYGITMQGGLNNKGVIFEYDISSTPFIYTKLFDFSSANSGGYYPFGKLTLSNNKLYGVTTSGGTGTSGDWFEYDLATHSYVKKANFLVYSTGEQPSGLVLASNGKFYGVTNGIFECDPTNNSITRKFVFGATPSGGLPVGKLLRASNGKIYGILNQGTANSGGGTSQPDGGGIYEYDRTTNAYTFKVNITGSIPAGAYLTEFSNGKFYFLSGAGITEYDPISNLVSVKFMINGANGGLAYGGLTEVNGKLYGMTTYGGANNAGVLFEYIPGTNTYSKKFDFSSINGINPYGSLTLTNGKLYGLTSGGGANSIGTLFEYDPQNNSFLKKADFTYSLGSAPSGSLTLAHDGNLWGMASSSGESNGSGAGTIFEFNPTTGSLVTRYRFSVPSNNWSKLNGTFPKGTLEISPNGKFYGATIAGGVNNIGVLFEFDPLTSTYTKKTDFAWSNGISINYTSLSFLKDDQNVTFNSIHTKIYGDAPFSIAATSSSGLPISYTSSNPLVATITGNTITIVGVGTTSITASQPGDSYTNPASASRTLTVVASQNITFNPLSDKTYGGGSFTLDAMASSGLPISYSSSDSNVISISGNIATIVNAGSAIITASQSGDSNFGPALNVPQAITINPAILTVTADSKTKVYGDSNPALTISYTGFKGTDDNTVLDTPPGISTIVITTSNSGNYPIILTGGTDNNYTLNLVNATLTVNKATLTTTASNATRIYGDVNPSLTFSYSGFKGSDDLSVIDTSPVITTTATTLSNAGTYPITLTGGTDGNYDFSFVNGTLTITQAALTATADTKTRIYGDANPTLTITYTGFKGTDNTSVIDTSPAISTTAITTSNAAVYPIVLAGGIDNNYAISLVNSTLTITKAPLTAIADSQIKSFNTTNPTLTVTYTGLKGTDNASVVDTPPSISTTATTTSNVGNYPITLTGGTDDNYSLTLVNGTLTIDKANQTITFGVLTAKNYGDASFTLSGSASSGLGITYTSSNTAVATVSGNTLTIVGAGSANITAAQAGNSNYDVAASVSQPLMVNKANQSITFNAPAAKNYGDIPFALTATASSGLTLSYASSDTNVATVSGNTITIVGAGTATITASQAGNTNYNTAPSAIQILTVNKGSQSITFSVLASKVYGDVAFTLSGTASSGLTISYVSSDPSIASVSGNAVTIVGAGACTITASQAGNANYNAAANVPQALTVAKASQSITFSTLAAKVYGDAAFTLSGTASSGLAVSYVSSDPAVASVSGSTVTIVGAGTCTITASQAGAANYNAATNVVQPLSVNKASQTITFGTLTARNYGDAPFSLSASTTSGLPVTFTSSDPAVATISGSTVTIVGAGTATITASQAGNVNYSTASNIQQTLTVNKINQTVTFAALAAKAYGASAFTLSATASSGLTITYTSSNTSVATVSGNTVTIVGAGSTTITASQAGDTNYNAATSVQQALTINKANQTITFAALTAKIYGTAPFALTGSSSSGLALTYTSSNTAIATISGSTVTIVGTGTVNITASQAGDVNYNAAVSVVQSLTINKANQTITFSALTAKTYGNAPFTLTAAASSSLVVSYTSSNTSVATVSGSTVTIVGGGISVITASQAGDSNYNIATNVANTLTVNTAAQTITFNTLAAKVYGDLPFNLTATSSSGLPVSYSSSNTSVATVSGNTVTILGGGTTTITASQPGNTNYSVATNVAQTLTVNKASQTITFNALPANTYGDVSYALTGAASSGLAVTYISSNTAVATVSGSTIVIIGVGTTTITASQAGNVNYLAATSVAQTLTINKANQTIAFNALVSHNYGDAAYSLAASASSGLTVSYSSSNTAVATVSGSTVTIVGVGSTVITASQTGNSNYNAASDVVQTLTVNKGSQTISFGTLPVKIYGDASFAISAAASSGMPVSFSSSDPLVATVSGNTVTVVGAGSAIITASQTGNALYNAAIDVAQTLTVNKLGQTISFGALSNKNYGDAAYSISATATSGLAVSFASSNTAVATVSGNTITITGPGTTVITASQAGNSNYTAAANVTQNLIVILLPPTEAASFIEFSNVTSTSMTIECFPGDGGKRLIVIKPTSPTGFFSPVDNTFYSAGYVSSGSQVVMSDAGFLVNVTGLSADTKYYVKVFEFNEQGTFTSYLTAGAPTASQRTLVAGGPGGRIKSDAVEVTVKEDSTALSEFEVTLANNPFRERLTLFVETSHEQGVMLSLMDISGKVVHLSTEKTNKHIDIEKPMASGLYFLKVGAGTHLKVLKVVKLE